MIAFILRVSEDFRFERIAMRIGLISDTHIPEACEHLPAQVFEVFRGVDLVMHAGDVYVNRVLDELATIAPVIAAMGNGDEGLDGHRFKLDPDPRVREAHLVELEGVRIGLVHAVPTPDETSDEVFARAIERNFGGPVDVIVQGHSHVEGIVRYGSTLVVNPGSATLPHNLVDMPGTVAILEVVNGAVVSAEIVTLGPEVAAKV
ncbi:MAG: metallophosphoesterase family protein [Candidatus Binataceae bacterium]